MTASKVSEVLTAFVVTEVDDGTSVSEFFPKAGFSTDLRFAGTHTSFAAAAGVAEPCRITEALLPSSLKSTVLYADPTAIQHLRSLTHSG